MATLDSKHIDWNEPFLDVTGILERWGCTQGSGDFLARWAARNPWNIPGPLYVGDDDACGVGPVVAPNNVYLHSSGGEFIFRQPSTEYELRQVIEAAEINPVCAYALDGDAHWTPEAVFAWWESMQPIRRQLREAIDAYDREVRRIWEEEKAGRLTPELEREREQLEKQRPAAGVRRWLDYLDHGAERYVHRYIGFLRARTR